MIPNAVFDVDLEVINEVEVNKTYKTSDMNIQGFIDELKALQQAIYKELNTEMYEYPIYSFNYGIELESLIGKDIMYVKIELKRRVTDCLMEDTRILNVDNFIFTVNGDELLCKFNVASIYGDIGISQEVNI